MNQFAEISLDHQHIVLVTLSSKKTNLQTLKEYFLKLESTLAKFDGNTVIVADGRSFKKYFNLITAWYLFVQSRSIKNKYSNKIMCNIIVLPKTKHCQWIKPLIRLFPPFSPCLFADDVEKALELAYKTIKDNESQEPLINF